MILYINALSLILILRSLFIICFYKYGKKKSWFYKYAINNYSPWTYRLLGLSILWELVYFYGIFYG